MKKLLLFTAGISILTAILSLSACKKDDGDTGNNPPVNETGKFTDNRDGLVYNWVKIGNQVWMTENLAYKPRTTDYRAYNDNEDNVAIYGYLYSWDLAQTIAPEGWHLPSQAEWEILVSSLGGNGAAYNKLLEKGTLHWDAPNEATNESGFTALPSGYYDLRDNSYNYLGHLTMFHSTTEYPGNTASAIGLILNQNFQSADIEGRPKELYLPIRCVKN